MISYRRKLIEFDYVSWIVIVDMYHPQSRDLFGYICATQKELGVPAQYSVLANDEENVRLIIKQFQRDICTRYFAGNLSLGKPNRKIKGKDMFFYLLFTYLEEHECDHSLADKIMYNEISRKSYGYWGGELYDSENELTDFGISYVKLQYIASEYCYSLDEVRRTFNIRQSEYLKAQIDKKRISISRM